MQHGSDAHRPPLSTQGTGRRHRGPGRTPVSSTRVAAAAPAAKGIFGYGVSHGFVVVDVSARAGPGRTSTPTPVPSSAAPDPRVDPQVVPTYARSLQTRAGTHRLSTASGPVGARSDEPA